MSLLPRPIALSRLSGRSLDRSTVLSALLMLTGFVTVYVAVHRPLLVIEGLFGALFLLAATRSPLLALAIFFALTFLSDLLAQVAGGSFNPAVLAAKGAGGALVLVWIYRLLARQGRTEVAPAVRVFAVVPPRWWSGHFRRRSGQLIRTAPRPALHGSPRGRCWSSSSSRSSRRSSRW